MQRYIKGDKTHLVSHSPFGSHTASKMPLGSSRFQRLHIMQIYCNLSICFYYNKNINPSAVLRNHFMCDFIALMKELDEQDLCETGIKEAEDKAAIKIQKTYRGYRARKEVKRLKEEGQ